MNWLVSKDTGAASMEVKCKRLALEMSALCVVANLSPQLS